MEQSAHACHAHASAHTSAIDPVCGMQVDQAKSPHRHDHHGRTYRFCSAGCRSKFIADPDKYLNTPATAPVSSAKASPALHGAHAAPDGTIYTCPMHPEIRQLGPGSCPICGMALEPETT
jgi:Cu+-exporting ATPase